MPNIISNHNKAIMTKGNKTECATNNCNCHIKETCLVDYKCQTSGVIYHATVTRQNSNKYESYVGPTDNTIETRCSGQTNNFRTENYRDAISLVTTNAKR